MKRQIPIADFHRWIPSRLMIGLALLVLAGCRSAPEAAAPVAVPSTPMVPPESPAKVQEPVSPAIPAVTREEHKKTLNDSVYEAISVGRVAGIPVALVDIDGNLSVVMTGILLMTHRVEEIDVEGGRVILRAQKQPPLALTVSGNNPIQWPELSREYVQSLMTTEGIMQMNAVRGIPTNVAATWSKVSRDTQVETLFGYLRQGLVVGIVYSSSQISTGFSGKLLEKQITDEVPAKKEAFLASLTAEQRELYEAKTVAVFFSDPPEIRDKQIAANLALLARQEEMLAGLTPEQRALYEEYQLWRRR